MRFSPKSMTANIRKSTLLSCASILAASTFLGVLVSSCEDTGGGEVNFDRQSMLSAYADELIVPGYEAYVSELSDLDEAWNSFQSSQDAGNLNNLQVALTDAWLQWQPLAFWNFGPATDLALLPRTNTFPSDTSLIQSWLAAGSWNLEIAASLDGRGFPALDYLLWSGGADAVLANAADATWQSLVSDLIAGLKTDAITVRDAWNSGYRDTFVAADGTDVGSSAGLIINAGNQYLEVHLRDGKIGIPLGVRSLGIPLPEKSEGFYSGQSMKLAQAGLEGFREWFDGAGSDLLDYIDATGATFDGAPLRQEISSRIENSQSLMTALQGESLPNLIENQTEDVDELYQNLQGLVIVSKVDVPSALGILITYQDNDGD